MTVVAWIAAVLGLVIVLSTLMSVVTSLVLPRRGSSRIQNYAGRGMIKLFTRALPSIRDIRGARPLSRAPGSPVSHCHPRCVAGCAAHRIRTDALAVHAHGRPRPCDHRQWILVLHARIRGQSPGAAPRLLVFCAAAAGLTIVALQIAYLPVLYGAFNRRETLVTMLDSRAGSPAWGPELLARSEFVDNVQSLATLYSAGRSGPPTSRSRIPRIRCCSGSGPRTRTGPGSSHCSRSWTRRQSSSRRNRSLHRPRHAHSFAWDTCACVTLRRLSVSASTPIRSPRIRSR